MVKLGDLIVPAKPKRVGDRDLPILSMTMRSGLVPQAEKFKKRVASEDTSNYKIVDRNDLVVGFPIDEGVLAFQRLYDQGIVSPAYDVWRLSKVKDVDISYLERFLRSPAALSFYASKQQGSTARRRSLPDSIFLSLDVPLPDIFEQRRLSEILDCAELLCRKRRSVISRMEDLERSIFLRLFGDPEGNPRNLPKRKLGEVIRVSSGKGLVVGKQRGGPCPVYGGNGVNGWHDEFTVPEGTIVVGRVGAHCGSVHVTDRPAWVTDNALVVSRIESSLTTTYLAAAIRHANLNQYAGRSAQPLVSGSRIYPVEILIPPVTDQERYEEAVRRHSAIRDSSTAHLRKLEALLLTIQNRAFRGELARKPSKVLEPA